MDDKALSPLAVETEQPSPALIRRFTNGERKGIYNEVIVGFSLIIQLLIIRLSENRDIRHRIGEVALGPYGPLPFNCSAQELRIDSLFQTGDGTSWWQLRQTVRRRNDQARICVDHKTSSLADGDDRFFCLF